MRRNQRGSSDGDGMAAIITIVIVVIGYFVYNPWSCHSRWRHLETDWGPIQGCLVKTPSGKWIPDDRIRDVDLSEVPKTETPKE